MTAGQWYAHPRPPPFNRGWLGQLTERAIGFITLRTPKLTAHLRAQHQRLDEPDRGPGRRQHPPRPGDRPAGCETVHLPGTLRQLGVAGLGHDEPTILITNRDALPAKQVIETYSRRMNIEQRLAEAIQSFHLGAGAGAVALNIDFDVVLTILAHAVYRPTPPDPRLRHR